MFCQCMQNPTESRGEIITLKNTLNYIRPCFLLLLPLILRWFCLIILAVVPFRFRDAFYMSHIFILPEILEAIDTCEKDRSTLALLPLVVLFHSLLLQTLTTVITCEDHHSVHVFLYTWRVRRSSRNSHN
uniref:Uncharacterized protein n=1 Tax=Lutzomyia longipalpis TaxID=7200 RepID=A0A7G3B4X8_LUTLO